MRLSQLSRWFITIRALEFAWILLIFVIAGAVAHFVLRPVDETWALREAVYAGIIMMAWYYVGFQYLLTSAVVMMTGWFTGLLKTPRSFVLFNMLSFVAHSLIVMLVILPGKIAPILWITWFFAVIFNGAIPVVIFNLRRSKKTTRSVQLILYIYRQ
jgi:hypothetical protein